MDLSLFPHKRGYQCSVKECLLVPIVSPYAPRHWQLANQSAGISKWGHRLFAIIGIAPVVGPISFCIERITAYAISHFRHLTPGEHPVKQGSGGNSLKQPDQNLGKPDQDLTTNNEEPDDTSKWWSKAKQGRKEIGQHHLDHPDDRFRKIRIIEQNYYTKFEKQSNAIKNAGYKLPEPARSQPLGDVFEAPCDFEFWMRGVAIIASYMQEKKDLKNLYVCEDVQALEKKVKEIGNLAEDQSFAFVVCSNIKADGQGLDSSYPQHKVTVCLKRKQNKLSVALLDAEPIAPNDKVNVSRLSKTATSQNCQELVLTHLISALKDNPIEKTFYFSKVQRQTHEGCTAFALHDAKAFLRDDQFFDKIKTDNRLPESEVEILPITHLPHEFMVGTQSKKLINAYAEKNPALMATPFYGKAGKKTLAERNQVNFVKTKVYTAVEGDMTRIDNKDTNQYMAKKTLQNLSFVHNIAMNHTEQEIDTIIANVWIANDQKQMSHASS